MDALTLWRVSTADGFKDEVERGIESGACSNWLPPMPRSTRRLPSPTASGTARTRTVPGSLQMTTSPAGKGLVHGSGGSWVRNNVVETGGIVPCTYRWITEGSRYVGAIAFRHHLTPALLNSGGHIGYGVRPSDRGRGAASWALQEMCARLAAQGEPDRVLLTCDDANAASARTIERCGGLLEDVRTGGNGRPFRRYWIDLAP